MKKRTIIALGAIILASCNSVQTDNTLTSKTKKENRMEDLKTIAVEAQDAFFKDYDQVGVEKYFETNYIQHNPHVPTGIEPIFGFLPLLKKGNTTYTNHRLLRDGDFIIFHNSYHNAEAFGAKEVVAFDVWRMNNGKVAEHWDNIAPVVEKTASGRSQVDGPTAIKDLEKTASNKAIVKQFIDDVLFGKAPQNITKYISKVEYKQHNPMVKDGLEGLNEAIQYLSSQNNMFKYSKTHKVLGEGNFILAMSEGEWHGKPHSFYDLFRLENNKIVEHWDVIEEIPAKMAHNNGKF